MIRALPALLLAAAVAAQGDSAPAPTVTLQGRVVDGAGRPVAAASIVVWSDTAAAPIGRTFADGEGLWLLGRLPGEAALVVEATAAGKVRGLARELRNPDSEAWTCNFELLDGVAMRGVVRSGERPVEGAVVLVRHAGAHVAAVTGRDGRYELAAVPPYGAEAFCFHAGRATKPCAIDGRGEGSVAQDFELHGAARGARVFAATAVPLALRAASWFELQLDGRLFLPELTRLPLGTDGTCEAPPWPFGHEVVLHVPGYAAEPEARRCEREALDDLAFDVAPLVQPASVLARGRLVYGGEPVAKAQVTVRDRAGVWLAAGPTAADGTFALPVRRPAGERVAVRALVPGSSRIAEGGLTLGDAPLELQGLDTATVEGHLQNSSGGALAFGQVDVVVFAGSKADKLQMQAFTVTDRQGRFVVRGLPEGLCEVSARDLAGNLGTAELQVVAGRTLAATLTWEPGAAIVGRIVDAGNRPMPAVRVHVRGFSRDHSRGWQFRSAEALTDRDGRYRLRGLAPDSYMLKVVDADGARQLAEAVVELGDGATETLDFDLR